MITRRHRHFLLLLLIIAVLAVAVAILAIDDDGTFFVTMGTTILVIGFWNPTRRRERNGGRLPPRDLATLVVLIIVVSALASLAATAAAEFVTGVDVIEQYARWILGAALIVIGLIALAVRQISVRSARTQDVGPGC